MTTLRKNLIVSLGQSSRRNDGQVYCNSVNDNLWRLAVLLVLVSFSVGCQNEPSVSAPTATVETEAKRTTEEQSISESAAESRAVEVKIAEWKTIEEEIGKHKGKIVVVDFWSNSCIPCKKEFPKLVALRARHPEGLVCVAVNLDYIGLPNKPASDYKEKVEAFLNKQSAGDLVCFLSSTPDAEVTKAAGILSLPAVLVLDADGNRVAAVGEDTAGKEGFSYEKDVDPLVNSLVQGLANRLKAE